MKDRETQPSYLRAAHLATKAPDVDLYINDRLIASNLKYPNFTKYIELPAGLYNIKLYEAGTNEKPALDLDINLLPNSVVTAAVYSKKRILNAALLEEYTVNGKDKCNAKVRAAQYIENTPPVNIELVNGPMLIKNANYTDIGLYKDVKPGTYTINVVLSDTDISIFNAGGIEIESAKYYTLYIIGQLNDYHDTEVKPTLDGVSYLK